MQVNYATLELIRHTEVDNFERGIILIDWKFKFFETVLRVFLLIDQPSLLVID